MNIFWDPYAVDNHTFMNPNFNYIIQQCLWSSFVLALIIDIYVWRYKFPVGHSLFMYLIFLLLIRLIELFGACL